MKGRLPLLCCTLIFIGAIGMQIARIGGASALVMPSILLASTSFIALATASGALRSAFGRIAFCGLTCCWIGDMVGPRNFLLGLAAFLVGHLFFAASFLAHGVERRRMLAGVVVTLLVSCATAASLWNHVPAGERGQFAAYCTVISLMVITAIGAKPGLPFSIPAAALFYVSDVCVARWRYTDSAIDGYFCYLLYYTACAMFAINVRYAVRQVPKAPANN